MTMKYNDILCALVFLMLLISCTDRHMDKESFNGEIRVVNDKDVICKEMNVRPYHIPGAKYLNHSRSSAIKPFSTTYQFYIWKSKR